MIFLKIFYPVAFLICLAIAIVFYFLLRKNKVDFEIKDIENIPLLTEEYEPQLQGKLCHIQTQEHDNQKYWILGIKQKSKKLKLFKQKITNL